MADQMNQSNSLSVCPHHAGEVARINNMQATLTSIQVELHAVTQALLGDLDGHGGMLQDLRHLSDSQRAQWEKVDKLSKVIVGNGVAGLDERVRNLEAVKNRNEKLSWVLVSAVIVQGLILIRDYLIGG